MFGFSRQQPTKAEGPVFVDAAPATLANPGHVAAIEALARGEYSHPIGGQDPLSRAIANLAATLQRRASAELDRLVGANVQIGETAVSVARILDGSRGIDTRTQGMAAAITEMVASVSQVSESTETVAAAMREANERVVLGQSDTGNAHRAMGTIADTVEQAADKIQELATASQKIGEIVKTIEAIASQTNLLALNATIEAARAGEAGKGFAVVAGEVKSLSRQTAQATDDIRKRIESFRSEISQIVETMHEGTQAAIEGRKMMDTLGAGMTEVGRHVQSVTERMSEVASIIEGQSAAAKEISDGVSTIAGQTRASVGLVTGLSDIVDASQKFTLEAQTSISELDFPGKIVRLAKSDHVLWKKRLADMAVGRTSLRPEELADHRSCRLGKWYYGDGGKACSHLAAFRNLEAPHERVHRHGIEAARLFQSGKHAEALIEIEAVNKASGEVLAGLEEISRST